MRISYPIRDTDGQVFRSVDDVMRLVDGEAHGTWLLGANDLWHGGIHISDISAPFSALNPDALNTGDPVPLAFMTDGTIVAYRLNHAYLTAPYCGQPLRYSSSFVLVKSVCQPDPQKEKSWLTFYCLYMHLAPVADYPSSPCYRVREGHGGISLRKYTPGQYGLPEGAQDEAGACAAPSKTKKRLNAGDRVVVARTGRFVVTKAGKATLTTFGLARLLNGDVPGQAQYWVTLDAELMEPDGELRALMPEWMQKAVQQGASDTVVLTNEKEEWKVSAGAPVGFMGCTESPSERTARVDKEWFVHLEVLSADSRMPAFLTNPEKVDGEITWLRVPKGRALSVREETEAEPVFTVTTARTGAECLLPREAAASVEDAAKTRWYDVTGGGWLAQTDVEEIRQYELAKQGFQPLEEAGGGDMMNSPYESWVPQAFGEISRSAEQGADYQYGLVPPFYRDLMTEMDGNRDGKVTADEIRQALTVRDPLVRNVVNRLVVKHHSEWCKGRSSGRWEGFYKALDPLEMAYCEKWQADLEWMSRVPPFDKDEAVWHFHPVVFMKHICTTISCACNRDITLQELKKVAPTIDDATLNRYLPDINAGFIRFNINTCRGKAHFLAQLMHESGYFRYTKEIKGELAGYSPWYGRGLIQITGEKNYKKYEKYIGEDVTSSDAARDKLLVSPHCVLSAFWYFKVFQELDEDADNDDFNMITARINGGFTHYNERLTLLRSLSDSFNASHLIKKECHGVFPFKDSRIYDNKTYALAWGLWHDPDSSQQGPEKNINESLKGYGRAQDLMKSSPFPKEGAEGKKKIYGIEKRNIAEFVDQRVIHLESMT
ncbi:glycoside hydrolase family 19 protein [Cronobacter dublinensis]